MGRTLKEIQKQWNLDMQAAAAEKDLKKDARGTYAYDRSGAAAPQFVPKAEPEEGWRHSSQLEKYEMSERGELRSRIFGRPVTAYTNRDGTKWIVINNQGRKLRVHVDIVISWFFPEGLPLPSIHDKKENAA